MSRPCTICDERFFSHRREGAPRRSSGGTRVDPPVSFGASSAPALFEEHARAPEIPGYRRGTRWFS